MLTNFPGYTMITNKFVRIALLVLYYILIGSLIYFTINFIFQIYYNYPREYVLAIHIGTILVCAIETEGLLYIYNLTEKNKSRFQSKTSQLAIQLIIDFLFVLIFTSLSGIFLMKTFGTGGSNDPVTPFDLIVINVISMVYGIIVVMTKTLFETYKNLNDSTLKLERFKKENIEAKLQSLKNQLSPHFLFNTLNTLYSIIDKDPEFAKYYLMKISDIHRYVLMNEQKEVVTLDKEITFAKDYAFLIEKRYGGGLVFELNVPDAYKNKYVPFLTLQILVENAIKHNQLDTDKKLVISVYSNSKDLLIVKNNIIKKNKIINGPGVGLQNLKNRYKYLADKDLEIIENEEFFIVNVPLIDVEQYEGIDHRR